MVITGATQIVIVGGGASGLLTAARILDASLVRPVRVTIIERCGEVGVGVAYSTDDPDHRLNVRAGGMSADPSDPGELVRWLEERNLGDANSFIPRRLYRRYLADHLERARCRAVAGELDVIGDEVVAIDPNGSTLRVTTRRGSELHADHVVIATGNAPPATPAPLRGLCGDPRWIADPWAPGALDRARDAGSVLLVGTGLTMVDVAVTLGREDDLDLVALSRHGLLPREHLPARPQHDLDVISLDRDAGDLVGLVGRLRAAARDAAPGDDWRDVIDSTRPFVNALWQRATVDEQARFLSTLTRYWDVHRHRMAPETAQRLSALIDAGRLDVRAGRVLDATADERGVTVRVCSRGEEQTHRVGAVVNCTGPGRSWEPGGNPVLRQLIESGLATPDPHGIGLKTTAAGQLVARDGSTVRPISVIGPPRRGTIYETTAIPELRSQALHIADLVTIAPPQL